MSTRQRCDQLKDATPLLTVQPHGRMGRVSLTPDDMHLSAQTWKRVGGWAGGGELVVIAGGG